MSSSPSPFALSGTELSAGRLVLRPWSAADVAAVCGGERRADWAEDFPDAGDRVIAGVIAAQVEASGGTDGHWLVVLREGGRVIGSISLLPHPEEGAREVGYGIVPSHRGRGYATEAARSLVALALGSGALRTVHAGAEPANPASVRVLEKAGLREVGRDPELVRFRVTAAGPAGA